MQVQTYRKQKQADSLVTAIKADVGAFNEKSRERKRLANVLKFACQEKSFEAAALFYPAVSNEDMDTWRRFLPVAGSCAISKDGKIGWTSIASESGWAISWENYQFDLIPDEVLEEVEYAKTLKVFNWLELRAPREADDNDPAIFGNIPGHYFLIARWGESLIPFERIRWQVQHPFLSRVWR